MACPGYIFFTVFLAVHTSTSTAVFLAGLISTNMMLYMLSYKSAVFPQKIIAWNTCPDICIPATICGIGICTCCCPAASPAIPTQIKETAVASYTCPPVPADYQAPSAQQPLQCSLQKHPPFPLIPDKVHS